MQHHLGNNLFKGGVYDPTKTVETFSRGKDRHLAPMEVRAIAAPDWARLWQATSHHSISSEYFSALSIPLVSGRPITSQDSEDSERVAVINQAMAKQYWPHGSPLDKRFKMAGADSPWMTVIGVAHDVKQESVMRGTRQAFFVPFTQDAADSRAMTLV